MPWTVRSERLGLPADSNCASQRLKFSWTDPPLPLPKKKTPHSPASPPGAAGIVYVAARMGRAAVAVQRGGAVHRPPPAAPSRASRADPAASVARTGMIFRLGATIYDSFRLDPLPELLLG